VRAVVAGARRAGARVVDVDDVEHLAADLGGPSWPA